MKASIYTTTPSVVIISDYMSGKMTDVPAISTSCRSNRFCRARIEQARKNGKPFICGECFADNGLAYKKGLRENCGKNYELFNERVLDESELPTFKRFVEIVREEVFGDSASVNDAINKILIAKVNPLVAVGCWTKNWNFYDQAFRIIEKPRNMLMVLSSPYLNVRTEAYKRYPWADHTFTVWTLDYLLENHIDPREFINCGARSCYGCRKCYKKPSETNPFHINELLKADAKRLEKMIANGSLEALIRTWGN